jgi:hypothetical protein
MIASGGWRDENGENTTWEDEAILDDENFVETWKRSDTIRKSKGWLRLTPSRRAFRFQNFLPIRRTNRS